MDDARLNQQLQTLMDGMDLNQSLGGASLTVFHHGQCVASLAHGIAHIDPVTQQAVPWIPQTLSLNFSTGKGVLVTLIHVLVSNGLLDYDTPIAQYWADFGKNGKHAITLRAVLSHEAGLFDVQQVTEHAKDMLDWAMMCQKVAAMPISSATFEAPKTVAYSALVSGWVLGGLVEQVTGMTLQQALEQYLLTPLGLVGQVYFGVPADKVTQVASQLREKTSHSKPVLLPDSEATLAFYQSQPIYATWQRLANKHHDRLTDPRLDTQAINAIYFDPSHVQPEDYKAALVPVGSRQFNYYHPASLQAVIPAANGVASSHALATIYAMLAAGGQWQGRAVITPNVFEQFTRLHNRQPDKIMPATMNWRLGYHRVFAVGHEVSTAFGHMGYNGSMAWCDPHQGLAVAFTHNYDVTMLNDVRQFLVNELVLDLFS